MGIEGREGKLGEMSKKRKRETEGEDFSGMASTTSVSGASKNDATHEDDEEFAGFTDDEDVGSDFDFEDDRNDEELEEGEEEGGIPVDTSDSASETREGDQILNKHHERSQRSEGGI